MFNRCLTYIIHYATCRSGRAAAILAVRLLCSPVTAAQDLFTDDTINISAVTVTAASTVRNTPFSISVIDSSTLAWHADDDLASLLQKSSLLSVKRYGTNGLASVSMRGLSGNHTLVSWNGMNITAPGTGMSDFALIPVLASSSVTITSGGSDLRDISGSIGGRIDLNSGPVCMKGTEAALTLGAGSFSSYSSSFTIRTGGEKISANLSLWGDMAQNNFPFINPDAPSAPSEELRTNSASVSAGVLSDIFLKIRKSTISAHLWLSDADRELPGPVTTVQQDFGEKQHDRSVRSVVKYSFSPGRFSADFVGGQSYESNTYTNESAGVRGDNSSMTYTMKWTFGLRINDKYELTLNAGDEFQGAKSLGYAENVKRNVFTTSVGARYTPFNRLRFLLQARKMLVSGTSTGPEVTAGSTFLLSADGRNIIRAAVSHNTRIASLNDLFWSPGGNAGLMPEASTGAEAAYSFSGATASGKHNSIDITLHSSTVGNLIQWVPGQTGLWSAENVRSVRVYGMEGRAVTKASLPHGSISASINYSFTRSVIHSSDIPNDRSIGKQLIYTPIHHLNANAGVAWRFINAGVTAVYESRRYTTSDNSEWLPESFLADASLGVRFNAGRSEMAIGLRVNNIFNTSYESVQNYPMPLRAYSVNMKVTIGTVKKNTD